MRRLVWSVLFVSSLGLAAMAPSFQGDTLDGSRIQLKEMLKPNRALLVSFWATWCTPCLQEIHHVMDHLAKNPSLPLDVITVNIDTSETATDVKPTVRLHKIAFPVILDPKHEILSKFQQSETVPYSVLIGADGAIKATFNGYNEGMFEKIASLIMPKNKAKETNAKGKPKKS